MAPHSRDLGLIRQVFVAHWQGIVTISSAGWAVFLAQMTFLSTEAWPEHAMDLGLGFLPSEGQGPCFSEESP